MVYIDKVHYVIDAHGCKVIGNVKWTNILYEDALKECTKKAMIDFINKDSSNRVKTKHVRYGSWTEGEDVRVVDNRYLRTDSNDTKADNLENLPRY